MLLISNVIVLKLTSLTEQKGTKINLVQKPAFRNPVCEILACLEMFKLFYFSFFIIGMIVDVFYLSCV